MCQFQWILLVHVTLLVVWNEAKIIPSDEMNGDAMPIRVQPMSRETASATHSVSSHHPLAVHAKHNKPLSVNDLLHKSLQHISTGVKSKNIHHAPTHHHKNNKNIRKTPTAYENGKNKPLQTKPQPSVLHKKPKNVSKYAEKGEKDSIINKKTPEHKVPAILYAHKHARQKYKSSILAHQLHDGRNMQTQSLNVNNAANGENFSSTYNMEYTTIAIESSGQYDSLQSADERKIYDESIDNMVTPHNTQTNLISSSNDISIHQIQTTTTHSQSIQQSPDTKDAFSQILKTNIMEPCDQWHPCSTVVYTNDIPHKNAIESSDAHKSVTRKTRPNLKSSEKRNVDAHLNKLTVVLSLGVFSACLLLAMIGAHIKNRRYFLSSEGPYRHRILLQSEDEMPILNNYRDEEGVYESWRNMTSS